MSGPNFYPMPTPPRRSIARWLLFTLHLVFFGCAMIGFLQMGSRIEDISLLNWLKMGLLLWSILLGLNLLLVMLLEYREGFIQARIERQRRREFESYRRKHQPEEAT